LILLRVAQVGLLFLSTIIVARQLGPVGRAQYALPLAAAGVAAALAHLSLGPAAVRLLSRNEATLAELNAHLSAAMLVTSAIAMPATAGYCLAARAAVANASVMIIVLCAVTVPCVVVTEVSGQVLIAMGDMGAWAWAMSFGALVQLAVLAVWIVLGSLTPAGAMAIALVGFATTAILVVTALARRAGISSLRPRWSRPTGSQLLASALGFHPGTLALQLSSRIDLLIVGALASARSAGLYSLALTLASSAYLVTRTLSLSVLDRQMQDEVGAALRFTAMFVRQAFALGLATCGVVAALSYPFITIIYGSAWHGSVLPFAILIVAVGAMAPEEPVRQMLFRVGRPLQLSVVAWMGVAVNAAATVAMFGALGITGAAIGSVVAFWLYAAIMMIVLTRTTGIRGRDLAALPRRGDPIVEVLGNVARRFRVHFSWADGS
jgi:O-antigen/teichoic acid export membrane protein